MFGLTYLSNDRQKQLMKLEERLRTTTDRRIQNETELLIQEIRAEAIPYQQCTLEQANDLLNQLREKSMVLRNLGKAGSVEAFEGHLRDVQFHMQTLQMAEALKEKNRLKPDEGGNLIERSGTVNSALKDHADKKKAAKQQAKGRTRWVIGMDEDEE